MKPIYSLIVITFFLIVAAVSEDEDEAFSEEGEHADIVGVWESQRGRGTLTLFPDRHFETGPGPKIEFGIWEKSRDSGYYLRYRARKTNEGGLSRAGHFLFEQGELVFNHDDEVERFQKVGDVDVAEENEKDSSYVNIAPEKLTVPATEISDQSIVAVIESLNETLNDLYPEHPQLPIIIERSRYPNDGGDEVVSLVLPEQELGLRLNSIPSVHAHWTISHNGFIIFKTWHLGVIDESAFDGFFPETDAELSSEPAEALKP